MEKTNTQEWSSHLSFPTYPGLVMNIRMVVATAVFVTGYFFDLTKDTTVPVANEKNLIAKEQLSKISCCRFKL